MILPGESVLRLQIVSMGFIRKASHPQSPRSCFELFADHPLLLLGYNTSANHIKLSLWLPRPHYCSITTVSSYEAYNQPVVANS